MPITVEAKSKEEFDAWVAEAQGKFARADEDDLRVADAVTPTQPAN